LYAGDAGADGPTMLSLLRNSLAF